MVFWILRVVLRNKWHRTREGQSRISLKHGTIVRSTSRLCWIFNHVVFTYFRSDNIAAAGIWPKPTRVARASSFAKGQSAGVKEKYFYACSHIRNYGRIKRPCYDAKFSTDNTRVLPPFLFLLPCARDKSLDYIENGMINYRGGGGFSREVNMYRLWVMENLKQTILMIYWPKITHSLTAEGRVAH